MTRHAPVANTLEGVASTRMAGVADGGLLDGQYLSQAGRGEGYQNHRGLTKTFGERLVVSR